MEKITTEQCDAMFAGIINFAHGIEKFMRVAEEFYVQKYMEGPDYKKVLDKFYQQNLLKCITPTLALQLAKQEAESAIRSATMDEIEGNGPLPYKKFLHTIREVIEMVEEFTACGMLNNKLADEEMAKVYDYMLTDADRMCRLFCRFSNIDGKDDMAEEAVMRYEERGLLSEEFINRWFRTQV